VVIAEKDFFMTKKVGGSKPKPYYSVSLERGLSVLRCFTPDRPVWNLTQIAAAIGLSKTSAYRFANTLVQLGYLKKDPQTKLMRLGPQITTFSLGFYHSNSLREIASPLVDDISEKYNITTELAFSEEDTIAIVYRREAKDAFIPRFPISRRKEQFYLSAIGKAIFSQLSGKKFDEFINSIDLVPKTENTITHKEDLISELKKTRNRGYALNNEEWVPGLMAIASPIMDFHKNNVIGAVCFDFSTIGQTVLSIEEQFSEVIVKLAQNISQMVETRSRMGAARLE
jgi:DNA-binding IclR family transcriptional regulator